MKRLLALALAVCIPSQLFANQLLALSFDELVKQSDVVVIGMVTKIEGGGVHATAAIRPVRVLKGDPPNGRIIVAFRTGIAELDPSDCCRKGKKYLLFLHKYSTGDVYGSTNGPHGFVALD